MMPSHLNEWLGIAPSSILGFGMFCFCYVDDVFTHFGYLVLGTDTTYPSKVKVPFVFMKQPPIEYVSNINQHVVDQNARLMTATGRPSFREPHHTQTQRKIAQ
ncbi:uncharacterized protein CLUP02_14631 [Colletotrichum lupini]|uniref:Uncharacterized protein n=1 Tax=Colletotrichum lupini TaxID=145971 RepID=A0A9Q8T561_9PEZI|nr:uncharacterized protein CLUP02_14631 [Colletotrichum lupini]UQC89103.1 hypothetical protein CLUP02_14631 [Colletotrichum lupini]